MKAEIGGLLPVGPLIQILDMNMLSSLVELDPVGELLEEHFSELHAQLRAGKMVAKAPTCQPKRPRTPVKVAPQSKKRRKQKKPENIATGRWNKHEHELFLRGLQTYGKEWKKIAGLIPSRTVVQIRTHAQKYFQKIKKRKARGESIDSVIKISQVQRSPATPKKKKGGRKKSGLINDGLPVLVPIKADKIVKTKRSDSKLSCGTKKTKPRADTTVDTTASISPGWKEPCRDGSPMSHFDLMFHFPAQSAPESAGNLFPTVFSADLGFDDMLLGEIPAELRSLEDMAPDKTGWPAHHELLSLEDWNAENDDFPDFNCSFASCDNQYPLQ